jgi:hypothetical protein
MLGSTGHPPYLTGVPPYLIVDKAVHSGEVLAQWRHWCCSHRNIHCRYQTPSENKGSPHTRHRRSLHCFKLAPSRNPSLLAPSNGGTRNRGGEQCELNGCCAGIRRSDYLCFRPGTARPAEPGAAARSRCPGVLASILEGLDEMLTVIRFGFAR